jgi:DnaJ family protein A protein 2
MFRFNNQSAKKDTELYDLLGVSPNASVDDIKKAYKRAALKEHPDKGGDEEKFKKISRAQRILTDPEKRQIYDETGNQIDDDSGNVPRPGPPPGFPFDINNIFRDMFHQEPGTPRRRQKGDKAPPKVQKVQLSLSQFYHGHTFEVKFIRQKFCSKCEGKCFVNTETCGRCRGSGSIANIIQMGPMVMNSISPCNDCMGEGHTGKDRCEDCAGQGKKPEEKVLNVHVKPGTSTGETIVFEEACSDSMEYAKPGDVCIVLEEAPDEDWKRNGNHLETTITLNLSETLVGCNVKLTEHPSGVPVIIEIRPGTLNGEKLVFPGNGMPVGLGHGNLYVTVHVQASQSERDKLRIEGRAYLASLFGIDMNKIIEV